MRAVAASLGLLALCACGTVQTEYVTPPCPAVLLAEPEPEPALNPPLTQDEQTALDRAVMSALGFDRALGFTRWQDVEYPAWARRQAFALEAARKTCPR